MPFKIQADPLSIHELKSSFDNATDYLYSKGVSRGNARIEACKNFLDAISSRNGFESNNIDTMQLWRETLDIAWVISVARNHELAPPPELLSKCFDGRPVEDYHHETGRSYFLQLRAAIYFLRVGYDVQLDNDCDVIAIRKRRRVFVECKRLYSENKAQKRIRKCYGQLEKRLALADTRHKNLGLAWIDPSAAMQKHFLGYSAYSDAGVRHAARMDLVYFWKRWISGGEYRGIDKRIFALVLQMVSPGWVGEKEIYRPGILSYVIPAHGRIGFLQLLRSRRLLDERGCPV